MKQIAKLIFILMILAVLPQFSNAQEDVLRPKGRPDSEKIIMHKSSKIPITLGVELNLNYNMFSADMQWTPSRVVSPLQAFESGSGIGFGLGFLIDVGIHKNWALQLRMNYDVVEFGNDQIGLVNCTDQFDQLINPDAKLEMEYKIQGSYLGITPLVRFMPTKEFFLSLGLNLQFASGDWTEDITSRSKEEGCYLDPVLETTVESMELDLTDNILSRTALELALGYKYKLNRSLYLVPQLRAQFALSKILDDETEIQDLSRAISDGIYYFDHTNKKLNIIQLSVALWFDL